MYGLNIRIVLGVVWLSEHNILNAVVADDRRVEETDAKLERELQKSKEELSDEEVYLRRYDGWGGGRREEGGGFCVVAVVLTYIPTRLFRQKYGSYLCRLRRFRKVSDPLRLRAYCTPTVYVKTVL